MTPLKIISALSLVFIFGCESKMSEKQAQDYSNKQAVDFKLKIQADLDEKMNRLQSSIQNIQDLISKAVDVFRIQKLPTKSILEMISQVNSQAQNQIPKLKDKQLLIVGNFNLDSSLLSAECQVFGYRLFSENVMPLTELNYSMKSCYTEEQLLDILKVHFNENDIQLNFQESSLKKLLPAEAITAQISECHFSENKSEPTVCHNLPFAQAEKWAWYADIKSSDKTQIDLRALSKKSGAVIYQGQIVILQNGKVESFHLDGPLVKED